MTIIPKVTYMKPMKNIISKGFFKRCKPLDKEHAKAPKLQQARHKCTKGSSKLEFTLRAWTKYGRPHKASVYC